MGESELDRLAVKLRAFASERDWDKYHSPKNLAMALSVEAGELLECFQWLTQDESKALDPAKKAAVSDELADVFSYLLRLADVLQIDVISCADRKIEANAKKYPIEKVRGSAKKYTEY